MLNRRKFLACLGIGAAIVAAPTSLFKLLPESDRDYYWRKHEEAGPGGWVSYRVKYTVTLPPATSPI
jgi:hypothetical protein